MFLSKTIYSFWEVATLWSREVLEHEQVIARALANAVIQDALRLVQS